MSVTPDEYTHIEEVYMNSDLDKDEFCKEWAKMNNNATAQKITLDDLNPETIERLFNVLQDAKNELYQKYSMKQVVCNGDDNIARIWDLNQQTFIRVAR